MKTLQLCQTYFLMLGISRNTSAKKFSLDNLLWIPGFMLVILSLVLFISREADSFVEYMFSVYSLSGAIGTATATAAIAFRTKKFFATIDFWEQTIDESK